MKLVIRFELVRYNVGQDPLLTQWHIVQTITMTLSLVSAEDQIPQTEKICMESILPWKTNLRGLFNISLSLHDPLCELVIKANQVDEVDHGFITVDWVLFWMAYLRFDLNYDVTTCVRVGFLNEGLSDSTLRLGIRITLDPRNFIRNAVLNQLVAAYGHCSEMSLSY